MELVSLKIIQAIYSIITLTYNKLKYLKRFKFKYSYKIHPDIQFLFIGTQGCISLGKSYHARKGVSLICDNGEIVIGDNVFMNNNCFVTSLNKVEIGNGCSFGPNVLIFDHDHIYGNKVPDKGNYLTAPVIIGKNVWVGANVVILRGSIIGDNSVIAAGSVVKEIVPSNSLLLQKRETEIRFINN